MFFDYVKEREDLDSIIIEGQGFLTYRKDEDTLFVNDLYVKPEFRKSSTFMELYKKAIDIGRKLGCKQMEGHVWTNTMNPTRSLRAVLAAGFEVIHADTNVIVLRRGL